MKIGILGLGKLGLPVALAIALRGHEVLGFDINPEVNRMVRAKGKFPHKEAGLMGESIQKIFEKSTLRVADDIASLTQVDILFVAVQTPNTPMYEGTTRVPGHRVDFDYSYLVKALEMICLASAWGGGKQPLVAIVSTVLPGTCAAYVEPKLREAGLRWVYNPSLIAMGTTIEDFLYPEYAIIGKRVPGMAPEIDRFYDGLGIERREMGIESAETLKIMYNTFIGFKIILANAAAEICHKVGADATLVMDGIKAAHRRLISSAYLTPGMGDGGACHPRDQIAMSWLARSLDMSYDPFEAVMETREKQAEWICKLMVQHGRGLPKVILGMGYKPESNLTFGSPSLLCANILWEWGYQIIPVDPHIPDMNANVTEPACFLVAVRHPEFQKWDFPEGSVVIDPFDWVIPNDRIRHIRIGRSGW